MGVAAGLDGLYFGVANARAAFGVMGTESFKRSATSRPDAFASSIDFVKDGISGHGFPPISRRGL